MCTTFCSTRSGGHFLIIWISCTGCVSYGFNMCVLSSPSGWAEITLVTVVLDIICTFVYWALPQVGQKLLWSRFRGHRCLGSMGCTMVVFFSGLVLVFSLVFPLSLSLSSFWLLCRRSIWATLGPNYRMHNAVQRTVRKTPLKPPRPWHLYHPPPTPNQNQPISPLTQPITHRHTGKTQPQYGLSW